MHAAALWFGASEGFNLLRKISLHCRLLPMVADGCAEFHGFAAGAKKPWMDTLFNGFREGLRAR
ncbi:MULTISPECIES: hypothetical protein [unclassified Duganella]|uniref:hypothetical protein n=1 Tax=unclassified Duganella TaxID=2636909 RepID=UPI000A9F620E|nr:MULTISPECIES: hypothetical protein [unclassified Duganella]